MLEDWWSRREPVFNSPRYHQSSKHTGVTGDLYNKWWSNININTHPHMTYNMPTVTLHQNTVYAYNVMMTIS